MLFANEIRNKSHSLDPHTENFLDRAVELAERFSYDKVKDIKDLKNSTKSLSADKLIAISNIFGIDPVDFFLNRYCEDALVKKISGDKSFINSKYLKNANSSVKFLNSLLSKIPSNDCVEYILSKLQISKGFLDDNSNRISIFSIKDASLLAKSYITDEAKWDIGRNSCQSLSNMFITHDFAKTKSTQEFYEAFADKSFIVEDNFTYKIIKSSSSRVVIASEQKDQSISPDNYSTNYINTTRAAFIYELSNTLEEGDKSSRVSFYKDRQRRTIFEVDLVKKKYKKMFI